MSDALTSRPDPSGEILDLIRIRLAEHFGCPANEIDTSRELASFGLSSLQAMILIGELEERTGLELDPDVFSAETLDELAAELVRLIDGRS